MTNNITKISITFFILSFLIIVNSAFYFPQTKAQSTFTAYISVGYGVIIWTDTITGQTGNITTYPQIQQLHLPSGNLIRFINVPNSGYGFNHFSVYSGIMGLNTTGEPFGTLELYMQADFTLISYNYLLDTSDMFTFTMQGSTGGSLIFFDNTTPNFPDPFLYAGTYTRDANDSLTFSAVPQDGYRFTHYAITNSESNGNTTSNPYTRTLTGNFTITAYFTTEILADDIFISGWADSVNLDNSIVIDRNNLYSFAFYVTQNTTTNPDGNISPYPLGIWNIEITNLNYSPVIDINTATFNLFDYGQFQDGYFNSDLELSGTDPQKVYFEMRVTVRYDDGNIYSEYYHWTVNGVSNPSVTPDPNTSLFGINYAVLESIIIFVICTFGLTYLSRRYAPIAGLISGIIISIVICSLLNLIPVHIIFVCVLLLVVLVILLLKGVR